MIRRSSDLGVTATRMRDRFRCRIVTRCDDSSATNRSWQTAGPARVLAIAKSQWLSENCRSVAICCERAPTLRGYRARFSAYGRSHGATRRSSPRVTASPVSGSQAEFFFRQPLTERSSARRRAGSSWPMSDRGLAASAAAKAVVSVRLVRTIACSPMQRSRSASEHCWFRDPRR